MDKNPWKTLSSKQVYESPWIEVIHNECINPAGKPSVYGTIKFKNLAIGILPLDENNYTWLVGQWRYPLNQYSWEIPEGGGKIGIDPLDSAKRELKEETGIEAKNYEHILTLHLSNSASDETAYVYIARELSFGASEPEESEDITVKKVHLEEAFQMVREGSITDAISVAAIQYAYMKMKGMNG